MRQVAEPPEMVAADVAITPFGAGNFLRFAAKVGEVVPGVAAAKYRARIAPVVVAETVGGKMDIAAFGLSGVGFFVAGETFPQVGAALFVLVDVFHDGFGAVAEIFQHFANASFKIESHDDKVTLCTAVYQRRRIAPKGGGADHHRFVESGVGEAKEPNFINLPAVNFWDDVEGLQDTAVIHPIRLMPTRARLPALIIIFRAIDKAIRLDRTAIYLQALRNFRLHIAMAGSVQIANGLQGQLIGIVPA